MGVNYRHKDAEYGPGEKTVLPKNRMHTVWNAGGRDGADLLMRVTFAPAGVNDKFWPTLAGLGHDYGLVRNVPSLQVRGLGWLSE